MVEKQISNIYDFESPEEGLSFLKKSIEEKFTNAALITEFNENSYTGFGVEYQLKNIIMKFSCERNTLGHLIKVNGNAFTLYKYDEQMKDILAFSKKNIVYTLSLLYKILQDNFAAEL